MDAALIAKYDRPGPRYTSYPTAPQWREQIDSARYAEILRNSNRAARPLSLYLHLPFCEEHCTFCGCNVIITKQKAVTEPYIAAVEHEYAQLAEHLDPARPVVQLHWGGGTPTYLTCEQLTRVWNATTQHFRFAPNAEIGIEVDPRVTTADQLSTLHQLGFNRLSLGVQDFNPQVQHAINRHQSYEHTATIITHGRALGFASINVDLIYGLPHQTVDSFRDTVQALLALNPDRVACYSFAYVPWLKAQQRTLDPTTLPDANTKLAIWTNTLAQFTTAGYVSIGFDHFAKPGDELSQALRHGTLWRNFQGYTTQRGTDLIACGITGISDVDGHYIQNVKKLPAYYRAVQSQRFPVEHGCTLSHDDKLRRHVIRELLCNNQLDLRQVPTEWGITFEEYFANTVPQLRAMATDGLLTLTDTALTITPRGRPFARNIAMCFDAYLTHDDSQQLQYSRTV